VAEVMEQTNPYLSDFARFEKETAATTGPALHRLRKAAVARFAELGFPGPRDEEWRFTPAAPLANTPFELAPAEKAHFAVGADAGWQESLPKGVIVCGLAEAMDKHPSLVGPHLARHADWKKHAFTALNTAFLRDGAFVYVPAGTVIEEPIIVDFLAGHVGASYVWHRRCLVVLGENSRATLAEGYGGLAGETYFTNAVTEVILGDNAELDHCKIQQEGDAAGHMAVMQVQVGRAARFASHAVLLGGAWTRNEVNAVFAGPGGECTLNGLYRGAGRQFVGNHTLIDHAHPHCASHELYKGVLGGKARGVFNGKIFVRQDAQKTDAKQTNKTLLLSEDATINSKPQLEIYADDVKCTHGATVGQLDEEATFYLRSRGVGLAEARALLTYAFANDIIDRIRVEPIRNRLRQAFLSAHGLPAAEQSEDE
jgi:Fe-S cluster assembly protein SufD